ncbi:MAG: protocatechuate 3,4-dioxygenase [Pseudomonadota bacterium]
MPIKVSPVSPDLISRRVILSRMGTALVALPVIPVLGCSSSSSTASNDGASSGTDAARSASDGGTLATDGGLVPAGFAVGSGAFLSGKDYGNPFTSGLGSTCIAYTAATQGPCHSNTYYRKDISDGLVGLPTRLELLVVDTSCNPVSNAIVEVWYASPAGTYSEAAQAIDAGTAYSGSLSDLNVGFCTGNNSDALASNWLRGYQYSGSDGRVTIDSIFPGWYASRTTHVHFIVTANGKTYVTSQLLLDESLTTAVYTQHPSYKARGNKDTTNANDMVAKGFSSLSSAIMSFSQQSDGAIVVWKAITIG